MRYFSKRRDNEAPLLASPRRFKSDSVANQVEKETGDLNHVGFRGRQATLNVAFVYIVDLFGLVGILLFLY